MIYPHQPNAKVRESEQKLVQLCKEYHVNLIAIGNGTASRESEAFVANTIKNLIYQYLIPLFLKQVLAYIVLLN